MTKTFWCVFYRFTVYISFVVKISNQSKFSKLTKLYNGKLSFMQAKEEDFNADVGVVIYTQVHAVVFIGIED